jgi:hypothetical protein
MNKTMSTSIAATTLALGLILGNSAQAASPSAKPTIAGAKKHKAAKGKEGTATHEMSEASTGTAEEGSQKVTKAKTSVIKKKARAKASPKASPKAKK